ncbi:MAG: hypothetical protein EZS28_011289 [Streblomastix strix]|uniref:Uncharacterized protein n=1 Tax=Streblomastix strix TaxID=222440 RepID=A0A5J4WDW3_9EUKA|nr:MAG: hypothetical protein EZS28_011289 [Streblomastix strix]
MANIAQENSPNLREQQQMEIEQENSDQQKLNQVEDGEQTSFENVAQPQKFTKKQAYINTVFLGLGFFLIFVATDTALHYLSVMFGSAATYFLAAYGVINGCLALFMPFILHFLGIKAAIHLSSILCLFFIAMILISQFLSEGSEDGSLPAIGFVLVIIGAAAYGCGTAMLWFSYSSFMDAITSPQNRGTIVGLFYGLFYINSPVGNLLAGILNATSLKGSTIQLIFTSFAVLGVLILIPLKNAQIPPGRYVPFKPYFKEMFKIAKVPSYYTVVLSFFNNLVLNGFLMSIFSVQLPPETAKQLVGYSFAIGGLTMTIGAFTWGQVIDRRSKRAAFFSNVFLMFLLIIFANLTLQQPLEVYGFLFSSQDSNQFWLAFDTCRHNPAGVFLGNCGQGIVSLSSIVGVNYPEYYIVLLILMGVVYALMGWNVDTHYASFAHVNEEDLVNAILEDPTLLVSDPNEDINKPLNMDEMTQLEGDEDAERENQDQTEQIEGMKTLKAQFNSDIPSTASASTLAKLVSSGTVTGLTRYNSRIGGLSRNLGDAEVMNRQRNQSIANIASTAHLAALTAEPGSVLHHIKNSMADLAIQAQQAVQQSGQVSQGIQRDEQGLQRIPSSQSQSLFQQQQQQGSFFFQRQFMGTIRRPSPMMPRLTSISAPKGQSMAQGTSQLQQPTSSQMQQPEQTSTIRASQQQLQTLKQSTLKLSPQLNKNQLQQNTGSPQNKSSANISQTSRFTSQLQKEQSSGVETEEQASFDLHTGFVPSTIGASSLYRATTRSALDQQINPTPDGLPPKGSRPPITIEKLARKQQKMPFFMGGADAVVAMNQDSFHPSQSSSSMQPKPTRNIQQIEQQSGGLQSSKSVLSSQNIQSQSPSTRQNSVTLRRENESLPSIRENEDEFGSEPTFEKEEEKPTKQIRSNQSKLENESKISRKLDEDQEEADIEADENGPLFEEQGEDIEKELAGTIESD